MTYRCIATKGVEQIIDCGQTPKQANAFERMYKSEGYEVTLEIEKHAKTYTESQVKEMILDFHNEHLATTIEIGEKEVDNWMERRNGNG